MAKEIILVRHTSVAPGRGQCYGNLDIDVSKNFSNEVHWLKSKLSVDGYKIFSSPLKRCTQLCEQFTTDYLTDKRLKELNYGDWEGKAWSELNVEGDNKWMYQFPHKKATNGESFDELKKRVVSFFDELEEKQDVEKVILFCHGGVIRSLLSHLLNISLTDSHHVKIHYVAQVKFVKEQNEWRLSGLDAGYNHEQQ